MLLSKPDKKTQGILEKYFLCGETNGVFLFPKEGKRINGCAFQFSSSRNYLNIKTGSLNLIKKSWP